MQTNKIMNKNKKSMNKKGDMSLQVVVVAVICIAVLAVLIIIFAVNSGKFSFGVSSCDAKGGVCGTYLCKDGTADSALGVKIAGKQCGEGGVLCAANPATDCVSKAKTGSTTLSYCCIPIGGNTP